VLLIIAVEFVTNEVTDVSNPGSFEDVVELLIPELQKRGIYWDDYPAPGGTARENLQSAPGKPYLPLNHPSAKLRWSAPKQPEEAAVEAEKPAEAVV
jgi:hypothetical protein